MRGMIRRLLGIREHGERVIAGTISLNAQLGDATGRSMNMQLYVYSDDTKAEIEKRIDQGQEIVERQKLRCEIPVLEATVDQRLKGLEQAKEVLAELVRKRDNGEKLSTQELNNIFNLRSNITKQDEDIKKGMEKISEAKRKANVG